MIELGSAIRRRREQAGLSQLDLALAVGYKNSGDISRIETGKQWPDAAKLSAISQTLSCAVYDLFAESEGRAMRQIEESQTQYQALGRAQRPESGRRLDHEPPTLDDALKDVEFMLTGGDQRELLAAIAYQGLMTRYSTERICSALNSVVMAIESLRDEVEKKP
ncbi:MAG: helix-turn-helix transcriptional regulator [Rhodocyclaceae bacterium]|nr:helix-turn-helix transcriptional regulator [Rhodocyclaceae bacterium]